MDASKRYEVEKSKFQPIYIIICGALCIHINQALALIYSDSARSATDMITTLHWFPIEYAPAVLICASGMAFIGLLDLGFEWYVKLMLLIPQQSLIALAVSGALVAVWSNKYGDGTPKPGIHIYVDQIWLIMYFIIHIYAVERRASSK